VIWYDKIQNSYKTYFICLDSSVSCTNSRFWQRKSCTDAFVIY